MVSLNPYFNGTCSKRRYGKERNETDRSVLILILMEHAQRAWAKCKEQLEQMSLNPYFNGTCSKRLKRV